MNREERQGSWDDLGKTTGGRSNEETQGAMIGGGVGVEEEIIEG